MNTQDTSMAFDTFAEISHQENLNAVATLSSTDRSATASVIEGLCESARGRGDRAAVKLAAAELVGSVVYLKATVGSAKTRMMLQAALAAVD